MNGLNSFDKTDREYSLAPTDEVIRFWRSEIKVIEVKACELHIS